MLITGVGRIGRDVEVRKTPSGDSVANISFVFDAGQKGSDGQKPSQWVDLTLWGNRADALAQYLLKGTMISIAAEDPRIEEFKRADGTSGSKMVARLLTIDFAGGPKQDSQGGGQQRGNDQRQQPQQEQQRQAPQTQQRGAPQGNQQRGPAQGGNQNSGRSAPAKGSQGSGFDDFPDDVPF